MQRVRRIVSRLTAQTGAFRPDAPSWAWEVHVFSSNELNAWCMAGGKMAIYTGSIQRLSLTDDEIAAVMGHEIAHALREHAREQASKSMATGIRVSVAGALLGMGQIGQDLMGQVAKVTFELPNSREHVLEADRMGVELAARAGYDPRAAVTLVEARWRASRPGRRRSGCPPTPRTRRGRGTWPSTPRVMPLYQGARR